MKLLLAPRNVRGCGVTGDDIDKLSSRQATGRKWIARNSLATLYGLYYT